MIIFCLTGCGQDPSGKAERIIHIASASQVKTLDPALAGDLASRNMAGAIFDTLLQYNYLRRPYTLESSMLEGLPRAFNDHASYHFTLRDDLYFVPDKCFGSNDLSARKVRSSDVIFSFLRIADSRLHSPVFWMWRNRVKGADEFFYATGRDGLKADDWSIYEQGIAGFELINDREFNIHLKSPDPRFLYNLAIPYTGIVSEKAVRFYGNEEFANHPVGSGPFRLQSHQRDYRIVLERYTDYRTEYFAGAANAADRKRKLPLADRIICSNIRQNLSAWLLFLQGELELSALNKDNADLIAGGESLTPALKKREIELITHTNFEIQYVGFSFTDPRLAKNLKLRQALSAAYDIGQRIRHANYLAVPAIGPLPPGVDGYDADLKKIQISYDLERAKKLLAEAGYPGGIDPATGEPLVISFDQAGNSPVHRQYGEMAAENWGKLGIKVTVNLNNRPRFYQKLNQGSMQTFRLSWVGDYPDAENFLQLFYGANVGGCNRVGFQDKEFDRMFELIKPMSDSPERTELYRKMNQYIIERSPWIFESQPISFQLKHRWLENYAANDFAFNRWKYWSVDTKLKEQLKKKFEPLSLSELREK